MLEIVRARKNENCSYLKQSLIQNNDFFNIQFLYIEYFPGYKSWFFNYQICCDYMMQFNTLK